MSLSVGRLPLAVSLVLALLAGCDSGATRPDDPREDGADGSGDGGNGLDDPREDGSVSPSDGAEDPADGDLGEGQTGDGTMESDGAPGDGDPLPVDDEEGIATLGAACRTDLEKACGGHNDTNKLVCLHGVWEFNGSCDGLSRCDTRAGETQGTCQGLSPECIGKRPGQTYCLENERVTCGADLLSSSHAACRRRSTCTAEGLEATCVCDTMEDGLGGCVKPVGKYWDNENGTIYDPATRLTWQQTLGEREYNFSAGYACGDLTLVDPRYDGGFRLPTMRELESIRDASRGAPTIDREAFPGTPPEFFWAAEEEGHGSNTFNWMISFDDVPNFRDEDYISHHYYRCVSGPMLAE